VASEGHARERDDQTRSAWGQRHHHLGRANPDTSANFSGRFHAEAWQADLDAGRVKNRAALAARERTSTVRVTQILRLMELEPSIRAWIRSLPPGTPARYLAERQLRGIATMSAAVQVVAVRQRWPGFSVAQRRQSKG
jgi:hypothetical protein